MNGVYAAYAGMLGALVGFALAPLAFDFIQESIDRRGWRRARSKKETK